MQHGHSEMVHEKARDRNNTLHPKSPDLKVIDHTWAKLKEGRILRYGNNLPQNPQQLWDQIMEILDDLAQNHDYCHTLFDSNP